jgi:pimeloyl-ACP methyl ester carboxylesterase
MVKWIRRSLLAVLAAAAIVVFGGVLAVKIVQWRAEGALTISTPNGIDDATFVSVNGREQWITLRGQDKRNPVLLVLHGGPGSANAPLARQFLPYEKDYTVVQWDQPGAGKTFRRAGNVVSANLTIADVVNDGLAIAELVKDRLHADKIILLGWSWGSVLGIEMTRARPDLFAAYVGTGQVVSIPENEARAYAIVLAKARELGRVDAVRELEAIGAPPYDSFDELVVQRRWASGIAGGPTSLVAGLLPIAVAPRYSILDSVSYVRGVLASSDHFMGGAKMDGQLMSIDLGAEPTAFEIPIVIIQGGEDNVTPIDLARAYFERITAPSKEFVAIEAGGHDAIAAKSEPFLTALNQYVRPLATH